MHCKCLSQYSRVSTLIVTPLILDTRISSGLARWLIILVFAADGPPKDKKTCISMEEWIDVWGNVVGKAKRMDDFPMWLQYYPKVLFDIINRSGRSKSG